MEISCEDWCDIDTEDIGHYRLLILKEKGGVREAILTELDSVVLDHYNELQRLKRWAERLNLGTAAAVLNDCLPTMIRAKSGHVGEIFLTEFVPDLFPGFVAPIKRLRWLDGREMALRGEDYIAVDCSGAEPRFLKAESKSRVNLSPGVVNTARQSLFQNDGNPTTHAMIWVASRLDEIGETELAEVFVDNSQGQIKEGNLIHVVFTFSGNDSTEIHRSNLTELGHSVEQHGVGLVISDHGNFIEAIYQRLNDAAAKGRAS